MLPLLLAVPSVTSQVTVTSVLLGPSRRTRKLISPLSSVLLKASALSVTVGAPSIVISTLLGVTSSAPPVGSNSSTLKVSAASAASALTCTSMVCGPLSPSLKVSTRWAGSASANW